MDEIQIQAASIGQNAENVLDKFGITSAEYAAMCQKAKCLPPAQGNYLITEYIDNLLLTVVDFMLKTNVVVRSMQYFDKNARSQVRTHEDLKVVMARFPDTKEGNLRLAQFLWGYNLWTRAELLRRYVAFLEANGVTDQASLKCWAAQSDFHKDFRGKVKGLGFAVYQWIIMRVGVDTFKPDVHVLNFVRDTINRPLPEHATVEVLKLVAADLGLRAYELDWRIWEAGRATTGTTATIPEPHKSPANDCPHFDPFFSDDCEYLTLLNLTDRSPAVVASIAEVVATCRTIEAEVVALLSQPNWRPHLVGAVAIALGAVSTSTLSALWTAWEHGSWVSPQLAAVASLVDPAFDSKSKQILESLYPFPADYSAKQYAALLTLCLDRDTTRTWADELAALDDARLMFKADTDNGGGIATSWLSDLNAITTELRAEVSTKIRRLI